MGAGRTLAAEMHAQKAVKQLRNQTNRQTNCDTANLGKTARANAQTLTRAIRFLEEQGALEHTARGTCRRPRPSGCRTRILSLTALCACFEPRP